MRTLLCLSLVFSITALAAGCEHADPLDPNRIDPTLSSIQANIFNLNCTFPDATAEPRRNWGRT